jgi:hypothetical protein
MQRRRWQVSLVLCICAATGCNLVLGNDPRSLAGSMTGPNATTDAGPTPPSEDAAVDSGADTGPAGGAAAIDAGPMMSTDPRPDAGPPAEGCASPDHSAECMPGKIGDQVQGCGLCKRGLQTRTRVCGETCGWGAYSEWTMCEEDPDACKPGDVQERVSQCGPCDSGRLISRRTCTDNCGWSEWSAEMCELDPLYCMPGVTRSLPDLPCGQRCGVIKQTQMCSATCTWNVAMRSACMEAGVCTPGETQAAPNVGCNAEYCMKGVQPQHQVCSTACMWGPPTDNGTCSIPNTICRPADLGGMGYRCSLTNSGYREPCIPSTASAASRCTFGPREPFPSCP